MLDPVTSKITCDKCGTELTQGYCLVILSQNDRVHCPKCGFKDVEIIEAK